MRTIAPFLLPLALAAATRACPLPQGPSQANDVHNRHAEPQSGIHSGNVARLRPLWKADTEHPVTHRPLPLGGRVYFADWGGHVHAVDARDGRPLWRKKVEDPKADWPWHGFCGTGALGDGLLFEASAEGNAFALDPDTGEVKWTADFVPGEEYAGNCGAILHHDGLVYIGCSSVEEGMAQQVKGFEERFRGRVVALDAKTGKQAWVLFLCEPPANGVAVWGSFALDPDTRTLFFGTGNNYSGKATSLSDSVVAVDARTGKVRWSKQFTANDVWTMAKQVGPDYDFPCGPQLFEAGGGDRTRKLLGIGQKSGVYHALDRETGAVVWQAVVGHGEIGGGIMADASVGEGRVFVWSNNSLNPLTRQPAAPVMNVKALAAADGAPAWVVNGVRATGVTNAGVLARDVYLVSSVAGVVRAYHAQDGRELWSSPADQPSTGASLAVACEMLFVGRGLPEMFGGNQKGNGLHAFAVEKSD